jgi:outer membrane autotransporter protein
MRYLLKILAVAIFFCTSSWATDISTNTTAQFLFNSDAQALNILSGGDISYVATNANAVGVSGTRTALTVSVDSGNATTGIKNTNGGTSASAINVSGSSTLSSLVVNTGLVTSSSKVGTVILNQSAAATTNITVGQSSGIAASITNTYNSTSPNPSCAICSSNNSGVVNLNITVNETGTISSSSSSNTTSTSTILFARAASGSALSITNKGVISSVNQGLSDRQKVIDNNTNNIATITNTGTINGKVVLGNNANSSFAANGGVFDGDIVLNNSAQNVTINGGVFNGFVYGSGNLIVNSDATFGGIGQDRNPPNGNPITSLTVGDGVALDYDGTANQNNESYIRVAGNFIIGNNSTFSGVGDLFGEVGGNIVIGAGSSFDLSSSTNSFSAAKITLDSDSSIIIGSGEVNAEINGATLEAGSVTFTEDATFANSIYYPIYDDLVITRATIASLTINDGKTVSFGGDDIRTEHLVLGAGAVATVAGTLQSRSDATLGENSTINLNGGISYFSAVNGHGNINLGSGAAVYTDSSNLGDVIALKSVSLGTNSLLELRDNSLSADLVTLASGASLSVGSGTVNAVIRGGGNLGSVAFSNNNTLGGTLGAYDVGSSTDYSLNSVTIAAGKSLSAGSNTIYSRAIAIGAGSTLTTSAAINGGGSNSTAVSLASGANLILNNGSSINATINGSSAGQGSLTFSNVGTIALNNYSAGLTNKIDSIIIDSGSDVSFNTTASIANSLTIASGSSAQFYGGGNIIDDVTVNGSILFDIGLSGAITVNNGGTINVPYVNNVATNSLTVNSGGILAVNIDGNSSGSITAAGVASLSANTTLKLTITGSLTLGHAYTLVSGGSGSSLVALANDKINVNSSGTNSYAGSALLSSVSGNDLILTVSSSEDETPPPPPSSPSFANPNQQIAYNNIIGIASPTGSLSALKDYLISDSNSTEEKSAALDSALTQNGNFSNRIIFNNINASLDLSSKRIQSLTLNSGVSSGEESNNQNKAVWGGIFGANARQGNTSLDNGYNANTSGIELGYDKKLDNHDIVLGISGSYASSNIKTINTLKQTSISSYQANLYAGYVKDNYFTNGFIGFVWNDYKSSRYIPTVNSVARGNYNGQSYVARIESGFNKKLGEGFILAPTIAITAAENNISNYSEDGAGTLNLNVRTKSNSFFEARSGLNLSNSFKAKNNLIIKPEIFASYGYDFSGSKQKTSSNFIGQSGTINASAANIAKGSWKAGVGLKIYGTEDVSVSMNYTAEHRQNYLGNSGELRVRVGF